MKHFKVTQIFIGLATYIFCVVGILLIMSLSFNLPMLEIFQCSLVGCLKESKHCIGALVLGGLGTHTPLTSSVQCFHLRLAQGYLDYYLSGPELSCPNLS